MISKTSSDKTNQKSSLAENIEADDFIEIINKKGRASLKGINLLRDNLNDDAKDISIEVDDVRNEDNDFLDVENILSTLKQQEDILNEKDSLSDLLGDLEIKESDDKP